MRRYFISILAALVLPVCTLAQTGFPPFSSIQKTGFEARNNQNLNAIFSLPIVSSPGRGMNLDFSVVYNSILWNPTGNAWSPSGPTNTNANWGWNLGGVTGNVTYKYKTTQAICNHNIGDTAYRYTYTYNNFKYVDAFGTIHPFSVYWEEIVDNCAGTDNIYGTFTGNATDGSGYSISISSVDGSLQSVLSRGGFDVTNPGTIIDLNGNYISSTNPVSGETDWIDTAGRTALKIITQASSILYKVLDPTGNYQTTTLNLQNLSVKTNFGCSGIVEYTGTASVPQSIVLPNGQQYSFTYESYVQNSTTYYTGRLQRVTFPTGGYHEYDYTGANGGINCADGTTLSMNKVVNDGTNPPATWNHVRNTSSLTTTITTPKLADTPNANDMVITFNSAGQEISRKICANSPCSGTALRTINTTWATNGSPATRVTILEDGSTQSEVATTYDSNGLLDSISEYTFGTGAPGGLFRITTYSYQTSTNYTNLNILDLVTSKQIKNASGIVQSRQDITYDGVALTSANCPTGAAQHYDTLYPCTFNYRGNASQITTYLAPATQGNPVSKNFTYDWFGNLRTAQVNCCQNETWAYSPTTQYSLPDSVTSGSSPGPTFTANLVYNSSTGQPTKLTDANNLASNFSYDTFRRPTQVWQTIGSSNVGGTVSYGYDDTHFTSTSTATIDSSKSVQQISAFDKLGRPNLSTTEDASNNVISKVSTQYDLSGRAYQTSNPYTGASASYWTTTAFDVLGRPTSVALPDGSATMYSYSTNTVTVTDPTGKQHKSQSDPTGQLVSVWEPDPTNNNSLTLQTTYTYNVLDELTQISQGVQTRTYVYDALGRLLSATTPEAGRVCFGSVTGSTCNADGYDSFDNLLKRTDARGVLTTYGYDTLNRMTSVSYNVSGATGVPATPTVNFTYGNDSSCNSAHGAGCIGQVIIMNDGVGSENYTYNNLEQLMQLQKVINGTTYTSSYAFNLANELTQITYPSGRVLQQSVDAIGRLCEVAASTTGCGTASSPYATGFGYSVAGQVTGFKYGNGIYASFGFSADRLQLNCLDYSTTNRSGNCTHDSATKLGLTYAYGSAGSNNGQISGITDGVDNGRSATYTYDSLYRLLTAKTTGSANYPAWGLQETYDRYGNRSAQTAIPGAGCVAPMTCPQPSVTISVTTNRLVGPPYSYDASGNMTNDGINTLVYDGEHRVTSAANGSSAGAYVYDGNGLRVQKCVPSCGGSNANTVYIFSGSEVIAEYNNGALPSSPTKEYIYSGSRLIATIAGSSTTYHHADHLSVRMTTDSSGNKIGEQGHFPYGEQWYTQNTTTKYQFTSYERDSESGNDYAQARYYNSGLARYTSPDRVAGSIADPQSLNRYAYVRNMPVSSIDPSGMDPCDDVKLRKKHEGFEVAALGPHGPNAGTDLAEDDPPDDCPGGASSDGGGGGSDSGATCDFSTGSCTGTSTQCDDNGNCIDITTSCDAGGNCTQCPTEGDCSTPGDTEQFGNDTSSEQDLGEFSQTSPSVDPLVGITFPTAFSQALQLILNPDCANFLTRVGKTALMQNTGMKPGAPFLPNPTGRAYQAIYDNYTGLQVALTAYSAVVINSTSIDKTDGFYHTFAELEPKAPANTITFYKMFKDAVPRVQGQTLLHEATHLLSGGTDQQLAAAAGVPNAMQLSTSEASDKFHEELKKKCK